MIKFGIYKNGPTMVQQQRVEKTTDYSIDSVARMFFSATLSERWKRSVTIAELGVANNFTLMLAYSKDLRTSIHWDDAGFSLNCQLYRS